MNKKIEKKHCNDKIYNIITMTNSENWGQFINIEDYNDKDDTKSILKKEPIIYSKLSIYSIISSLLSFVGYEIE